MRIWWTLLLGLLVSCSPAVDDEGNFINLSGRTFVSQSVVGRTLLPNTEIRLRFERGGRYTATAGCDILTGIYRFDGEVLVVSTVSSTNIGCDVPHREQDTWLAAFLVARPTIDLADPRFTLTTGFETVAMLDREIASPDRPLIGTQWIGGGIDTGGGLIVTTASSAVNVAFGQDGQFQAYSGCQRASGNVVADNRTIYFTALTYDGGICPDADLQPQSANFLFVLNGLEVNFAIEERQLTISRAGMTLYFTSAQ
jgi:heat shock protein HslJ